MKFARKDLRNDYSVYVLKWLRERRLTTRRRIPRIKVHEDAIA
jgi:hypothetical protein